MIKIHLCDACQWEMLITSSLSFLKVFKFIFKYKCKHEDEYIFHEKFKQFQSDFWQKQHQWFTEYSFSVTETAIYTIPYISINST